LREITVSLDGDNVNNFKAKDTSTDKNDIA
jgi:hypothetical protein